MEGFLKNDLLDWLMMDYIGFVFLHGFKVYATVEEQT